MNGLNIDNGLTNAVLILDLKKAFDTINHSILVLKVKLYGMMPKTVSWFSNCLSQRTHNYNGTLSDSKLIRCGIPPGVQSTILVIFIVY